MSVSSVLTPIIKRNIESNVNKENRLYLITVIHSLSILLLGFTSEFLFLFKSRSSIADTQFSFSNNFRVNLACCFCGMIAGGFSGALCDFFGRLPCSILCSGVFSCCMILVLIKFSLFYSCMLWFIIGLLLICIVISSSTYIIEILPSSQRWIYLSIFALAYELGFGLAFLVMQLDDWRYYIALNVLVSGLLSFGSFRYCPLSPRWLLINKTPGETVESLRILRGTNDVTVEFNAIYRALAVEARLNDSFVDIFRNPTVRIRFIIMFVMIFLSRSLGNEVVYDFLFGYQVMESTGILSPTGFVSILIFTSFFGSILGIYYSSGRMLLLTGIFGFASACFVLFFVFLFGSYYGRNVSLEISSIVVVIGMFFYSFGLHLYPFLSAAEIFPYRFRSKIIGIMLSLMFVTDWLQDVWVTAFVNISSFRRESVLLLSFVLMLISVLLVIFVYYMVPDTSSCMLEDMENLFDTSNGHFVWGMWFTYDVSNNPKCSNTTTDRFLGQRFLRPEQMILHRFQRDGNSSSQKKLTSKLNNSTNSSGRRYSFDIQLPSRNGSNVSSNAITSIISSSEISSPMTPSNPGDDSFESRNSLISSKYETFPLFSPDSIHRYSHDMKEIPFEYYDGNEKQSSIGSIGHCNPTRSYGANYGNIEISSFGRKYDIFDTSS